VRLAGVDDVQPAAPIDVLTCFDLFPHLTEQQAVDFLRRIRPHVRTALIAVIATYVTADEQDPADRDLSHITRQPHEWWDARFREAEWRQTPLQRNFERLCQQHDLPRRMGWTVYVYSPE
jgi:cyclopropane fatty-acyl-phospholipid synthase-like methyltransferase